MCACVCLACYTLNTPMLFVAVRQGFRKVFETEEITLSVSFNERDITGHDGEGMVLIIFRAYRRTGPDLSFADVPQH